MFALAALMLKSLAIAAGTLLALRVTHARSASERSLIAHLGLAALVVLPLATVALPALNVPLPEAAHTFAPVALPAVAPDASDGAAPAMATPNQASAAPVDSDGAGLRLPADWPRYAYALPVVALLLLTLGALLRLVRLRAQAEVLVDPLWLSALAHAQRRMGLKSGTALLVSETLPSPISWGLARPTIVLSADALAATGEAEAIIAHELAHVTAYDWVKLMLARVATAIHWFNPLAWRLAREAHQLREEAADDAVLAADIAAPDYAQLLVRVARHESRGLLLGAHGVAPGPGSLKRRVGRVLDATLPRGPARGSWMAGFGAGMLVMAAPLAALTVGTTQTMVRQVAAPYRAVAARDSGTPTKAAPTPAATPATPIAAADGETSGLVASQAAPMAAIPATVAGAIGRAVQGAIAAVPQPPAPPAPPQPLGGIDIDALISAKATGASPADLVAMRRAAPGLKIELDDLAGMRAVGVTPEYVAALYAAGFRKLSAEDIVAARATGLSPRYVSSLSAAGFHGDFDDYVALSAMGVTAADIRSYRASGVPLEIDALVRHRARRGPTPAAPPGGWRGPSPPSPPDAD